MVYGERKVDAKYFFAVFRKFMKMKIQFFLLVFAAFICTIAGQDCSWNKDSDFAANPSLLINKDTWEALLPVDQAGSRIVSVPVGTNIVIVCSGSLITDLGVEVAEGVCTGGTTINVAGGDYNLDGLGCTSRIDDGYLPTQQPCPDVLVPGSVIEYIGFNVPGYPQENNFYATMQVCFDTMRQITLWVRHILYGKNIAASDGNDSRPSFKEPPENNHYNVTVNDCYLTANQEDTFNTLLGYTYIDNSVSDFFSRGHLAPNADFILEMDSDSSFYFTNAVPQWQPYNGGNWVFVESDTRDVAESHNENLDIWTGPIHMVLLEQDSSSATVEMILCLSQGEEVIPIPNSVWKVVYENATDRGVAIVTSNDPYESSAPTPVCPDIDCNAITWLDQLHNFMDDGSKGYSYCCTVQDLRSAVPYAPNLPTASILDN